MPAFIAPLPRPFRRHICCTSPRPRLTSPHTRRTPRHAPRCQRIAPAPAGAPSPALPRLQGEWAGYEASFTASGSPIPIPDVYIPDEFREWGIAPSGFECHTSVHHTPTLLHAKHLRVLPAVSHFGDHVDVEEEEESVELGTRATAVFDDGSYVAGPRGAAAGALWRKEDKLGKWPTVEIFVARGARGVAVRLPVDLHGAVAGDVRVVVRERVGDFQDGGVMEGGSGYVSGWVDQGGVAEIAGPWRAADGNVVEGEENGAVCLPAGVDLGVRRVQQPHQEGYRTLVWAGWTLDGERIVVRRLYDGDGGVVYSERVVMTRDE